LVWFGLVWFGLVWFGLVGLVGLVVDCGLWIGCQLSLEEEEMRLMIDDF
jgi:hypothetical protein